jgi:REP element-mobilizing transposase RayT
MTDSAEKSPRLPQRKSLRLREFDYPATFAYSVTICTRNRAAHFRDERAGREVAHCLEEQAQHTGYRLVAYCIMPDHIHILTGPSHREGSQPLPRFIQRFKSAATHRLWKLGINGVVWQASFYDHVLRKGEDLARVAEYILGNPVRKGLVSAVEAYPLSRYFPENSPA